MGFINLSLDNLENQHICCAISDKKHQYGVELKKKWISNRIKEGHIFRKFDANGKVFIEYAPLESAWVPVSGENYLYIYCLWVAGSYKGKGYGNDLINYCINDAKQKGKSGVCILSSKKKLPFLSEKKFLLKHGFETVDTIDAYELLALSFDGTKPGFNSNAKKQTVENKSLTVYYGLQCPYIPNCIEQIETYCKSNNIPLSLIAVDSLTVAKDLPCVFNNWAVFLDGKFVTNHLLNTGFLEKLIKQ